jgi:hypothetical protein
LRTTRRIPKTLSGVSVEPVAKFVVNPLSAADIPQRATLIGNIFKPGVGELELETINTESNILLQFYSKENIWKPGDHMKCLLLRGTAFRFSSCFGSTCIRESTFSSMKQIKSKHRSRFRNSHLNDCLRIATLSYVPDFKVVVEEKQ